MPISDTVRSHPRPGSNSDGLLVAGTLKGQRGRGGGGIGPEETLIAAPLTSGGHPNSNAPGRRKEDDVNIVVQGGAQQDQFVTENGISPTLAHASNTHQGHHQPKVVTYNWQSGGDVRLGVREDYTDALSKSQVPAVGVRRLTPRECERLQGFPDDWTQLGGTADSKRYSAVGDAVTVNVAEWIGGRLAGRGASA